MAYHLIQADAGRLPLADGSVSMCIGSPPYLDARRYLENGKDLGIARKCADWVEWMISVTEECLRVSQGLVVWVCSGKTEDWTYQPGPEGLSYEWWKRGGSQFRPCYWHRSGIPGSGGEQWYRGDVEYVLAFKRHGKLPFANPLANGSAPKFKAGGKPSHRTKDGSRVNETKAGQWKRGRRADGKGAGSEASWMSNKASILPEIANPGNILSTGAAGGGHLGSSLAHESVAPYPSEVPGYWINSHCPEGGTVLDPFSGSGSTGDAAIELGRNYIGCDLRLSQCKLARRRLRSVTPGFTFSEAL